MKPSLTDAVARGMANADKEEAVIDPDAESAVSAIKLALRSAPGWVCILDTKWDITFLNNKSLADYTFGEDPTGSNFWDAFQGNISSLAESCIRDAAATGGSITLSYYHPQSACWYELNASPNSLGIMIFMRDVTDIRAGYLERRNSEERLRLALDASSDGAWDWDIGAGMILFSEQWCERHHYTGNRHRVDVDMWRSLVHPDDLAPVRERIIGHMKGTTDRFEAEYRIRIGEGDWQWNVARGKIVDREPATGRALRMVGTDTDISAKRQAEERIWWTATHDALTELPNRRLFQETLITSLCRATRDGGRVGILLLDVDHFKEVNDMFGHDAGDALLCTFAGRLAEVVDTRDTVARLGGDEFAIILPELQSEEQLARIAQAIFDRLADRFSYNNQTLTCRASAGAAIYRRDGATAEELMKSADIALYMSKANGRAGVSIYSPEMRDELVRRTAMLSVANAAIEHNRIEPFYQPQICLDTGRVVGFEALLRWRDEEGQIHLPSTLAAAFEDYELSVALSERMLARVFSDMQRWLRDDVDFRRIAINASAAEFADNRFAERLIQRLESYGIPARYVELEITETVLLCRSDAFVTRALRTLNDYGVTIALDDFGTGYSSLTHLRDYPVGVVKIDALFVRNVQTSPVDAAIARSVMNLARELEVKIVVEGIERSDQVAFFSAVEGIIGQGYHFAWPAPASEVPALARRITPPGSAGIAIKKLTSGNSTRIAKS